MQKYIEEVVNDINSSGPTHVEQTIRLENCEVVSENTMRYNYTFLFIDATIINKEEFESQISNYVLYATQKNERIKELRKMGVNFIYSCKDEKGNVLSEIKVSPKDYNGPVQKPVALDPKFLTDDNLHRILQSMVDQTRSQLPLFTEESGISMIDCRTYDKTLEYTCKLLNEDASRFDTIYFKTTGVPAAIEALKNNPEMKSFAKKGVYISNIYLDQYGKYLCTITISPEEYL